jgi:hypothetical protein
MFSRDYSFFFLARHFSFCYKVLPDGSIVAPLGKLDPVVSPTCHIFCKDKGNQQVMFPNSRSTMNSLRNRPRVGSIGLGNRNVILLTVNGHT